MIKKIDEKKKKTEISKKVLMDLPEWFGIPESTQEYIDKSKDMPFFTKYHKGIPVGFISLKKTSPSVAEIYCIGIMKEYHRMGYGYELLTAFEEYAKEAKFQFVQVKTVQEGIYECYDQTASFYRSVGFVEFELFPSLWGNNNPCQVWIKSIS